MSDSLRTSSWEELRERIAHLNEEYSNLSPQGILSFALNHQSIGPLAVVSSFGADSAVILSMVAKINKSTPIFFLDTLKHFQETHDYIAILKKELGLSNVSMVKPRDGDLSADDPDGKLNMRDAERCCYIRKTLPMIRALNPYKCWVTGRKRFQNSRRNVLEVFEFQDRWIKINPLAHWSAVEIADYARAEDLPPHPLVSQRYLSIGCVPCTSPVPLGESDPRAGRWAGQNKTECGIHFVDGKAVRKK